MTPGRAASLNVAPNLPAAFPTKITNGCSVADSLGIEDYFWQEGGAAEESFIPAFDLEGVLSE